MSQASAKPSAPALRRSMYSASRLAPISRAAWVTMPVAASAETNARCRSGVIEFRRGALWMYGANCSNGSSAPGGSPRNAVRLVRREGRTEPHSSGSVRSVGPES